MKPGMKRKKKEEVQRAEALPRRLAQIEALTNATRRLAAKIATSYVQTHTMKKLRLQERLSELHLQLQNLTDPQGVKAVCTSAAAPSPTVTSKAVA